MKKFISYYSKIREFTTGNSLETLRNTNNTKEYLSRQKYFFGFVIFCSLFVNLKMTVFLISVLLIAYFIGSIINKK